MVLAGLQRAAADSCQVISLSLGIPIGWLSASPAQKLVDFFSKVEGRHILNANGNEGTEGEWRIFSTVAARRQGAKLNLILASLSLVGAFFTVAPAASLENSAVGSASVGTHAVG
jgi:hypothetical protein